MSQYQTLIAEEIATGDPDTLTLIEELMRSEHPTLDHLTRAEFRACVIQAVAEAAEMERAGFLPRYCAALGINFPDAAR